MGLATVLFCLWTAGCGTPGVNPAKPRANTGYVDFYTDANLRLCWEVKRAKGQDGKMVTVFSKYAPVEGRVLRLAAPPGEHRFQVWFMNQVTEGPQTVQVRVANAKVTPVLVTLTPAGATSVQSKDYEFRPTARATRRLTRVATVEQEVFHIGAVEGEPQEYQPKECMPYVLEPTQPPSK